MAHHNPFSALRATLDKWIFALRTRKWIGPLLLVGSALCFLIFATLTFDAVRDQTKPLPALLALPFIGLVTLFAALVLSWKPGQQDFRDHLFSAKGGATVALALMQAIGGITSVLGLFEPRGATTADTDQIGAQIVGVDNKVNAITKILRRRFPDDPPVLNNIVGRWGEQEPRCGLVWAISIVQSGEDAALVAEIVERPQGVKPFRLLSVITRAEGNRLWITGLEPAKARGRAAEFTVNTATGRLVWDDKASPATVEEYVRCPALR